MGLLFGRSRQSTTYAGMLIHTSAREYGLKLAIPVEKVLKI
jgi:hypothetical protein